MVTSELTLMSHAFIIWSEEQKEFLSKLLNQLKYVSTKITHMKNRMKTNFTN